ncbi:MAG: alginate O-acetyltransferase complex protein AlgI [Flavobacteriaceae bacterium]|jgi:alginate O-acetyltransferase complex protein AlgI
MVFSSAIFLLYFLPVFLLVYFALPKTLKNWWILAASIAFYAWGEPKFLFILMGSTVIDYFLVRYMHSIVDTRKKRRVLLVSILMNVGLLAFFKYANFFMGNVNGGLEAVGSEAISWKAIALPVGISFYTFQTLTYSIDVYRGVNPPLKKLHLYLLYIMSFPQMIAGPIVRFGNIASQLVDRPDSLDDRLFGFYRFCLGLAKKVLIANVLGELATQYIDMPMGELTFTGAWVGIIAFTFQIYFDFAGYSDMAIGLGRMMGFKFPENFNNPYNSKNITEFWQRWHITLGRWMKDYLYIPLGGNRGSNRRLYINLWIVFLISGLWHGASWNFVIWGAFHGLFLVLDRVFLKKLLDRAGALPATIITFFITVIGWCFFAIEDVELSFQYLHKMFSIDFSTGIILNMEESATLILAGILSFLCLFSFGRKLQTILYAERLGFARSIGITLVAMLLFGLSLSYITSSEFNPFIYYRF